MLDRKTPPPFLVPESFIIPVASKHDMSNGNVLNVIHTDNDALLKIDVFFPAGRIYQNQASIAALTIDMLFESTQLRTAMELAEEMDFYGAYTDYAVRAEWASVTLYTLNKHLKSVLPYFIELLTLPAFKEEELKNLLNREIQDLSVALEKNNVLAQHEATRKQWGASNALGMVASVENFKNINRATIQSFFDQHYTLGDAKIFVAGNTDEEALNIIKSAFALGRNSEIQNLDTTYLTTPTKGEKIFIEKPNSLQAALRIVRKHIPRTHPDYNDTQMLNLILGGYFGSRLMDNLREDKGYTYGVGSSITDYRFGSEWSVGTEVKNDVREDAVKQIFIEMDRLTHEPVEIEELNVARNYLLGQILRSLDGAYNQLRYAESAELNGFNYDLLYAGFNRIKNITPEDLVIVAKRYLNPKDWLIVVCGSSISTK